MVESRPDAMQQRNPYLPPRSGVERDDSAFEVLPDAGLGRRLVNNVVDIVALQVCVFILALAVELTKPGVLDATWAPYAVSLVSVLGYYTGFEYVFGWTPGKLFTRTRVVTLNGAPPSLGNVLARSATRLIPFEPLSFLGVEPRGWHDRWSDTRVVRVGSAEGRGAPGMLGA